MASTLVVLATSGTDPVAVDSTTAAAVTGVTGVTGVPSFSWW